MFGPWSLPESEVKICILLRICAIKLPLELVPDWALDSSSKIPAVFCLIYSMNTSQDLSCSKPNSEADSTTTTPHSKPKSYVWTYSMKVESDWSKCKFFKPNGESCNKILAGDATGRTKGMQSHSDLQHGVKDPQEILCNGILITALFKERNSEIHCM